MLPFAHAFEFELLRSIFVISLTNYCGVNRVQFDSGLLVEVILLGARPYCEHVPMETRGRRQYKHLRM